MVQWLRVHAPNAGGLGSVPGQGSRARMLQLRPGAAKKKKQNHKSLRTIKVRDQNLEIKHTFYVLLCSKLKVYPIIKQK